MLYMDILLLYRFAQHIQEKEEMELRPVFTLDGITYVYIKVSDHMLIVIIIVL